MNVGIFDLLDYGNVSKNKTVRILTGIDTNGGGYMNLSSGLWRNTSAVSSITIAPFNTGTTLATNASFALYGVK
jgi:hypothetical protein